MAIIAAMDRASWPATLLLIVFLVGCGKRPAAEPSTIVPKARAKRSEKTANRRGGQPQLTYIETKFQPLFKTVDLDIGEEVQVELDDGKKRHTAKIKLVSVQETYDSVRGAVRKAEVAVIVDRQSVKLACGNFNLPRDVGAVRIDCPVTSGYNLKGDPEIWGLDKRARLRVWPIRSRLIRDIYTAVPLAAQPRHARSWGENQPIDFGPRITQKSVRYEAGICFSTGPRRLPVFAMCDGQVVSLNGRVWTGLKLGPGVPLPFKPKMNALAILDSRGWFIIYENLAETNSFVQLGGHISTRNRLGLAGGEGTIPGVSTFRFEIRARQPSGKWGTVSAFALLMDVETTYLTRRIGAMAGPSQLAFVGEKVQLDGSRSFSKAGPISDYQWQLGDGTKRTGPKTTVVHAEAGTHCHVLRVKDKQGRIDYASIYIQVVKKGQDVYPPFLHLTCNPILAFRHNPVLFGIRAIGLMGGMTRVDFADGRPAEMFRSNPLLPTDHPDAYRIAWRTYHRAGHYIIRGERRGDTGVAQAVVSVIVK